MGSIIIYLLTPTFPYRKVLILYLTRATFITTLFIQRALERHNQNKQCYIFPCEPSGSVEHYIYIMDWVPTCSPLLKYDRLCLMNLWGARNTKCNKMQMMVMMWWWYAAIFAIKFVINWTKKLSKVRFTLFNTTYSIGKSSLLSYSQCLGLKAGYVHFRSSFKQFQFYERPSKLVCVTCRYAIHV